MEIHAVLVAIILCTSSSTASTDIETNSSHTEVKLESQDLEVVELENEKPPGNNFKISYKFQCIVKDLTKEELSKLTNAKKEEDLHEKILINVYGTNTNSSKEEFEGEQPHNVHLKVVNDTLIITGEIRANISDQGDEHDGSLPATTCDVIFLDENEKEGSRSGKDLFISSSSSGTAVPKIITGYNHVVLMRGAPDQVVSCMAEGHPLPQMKWIGQGQSETVILTKVHEDLLQGRTSLYLLFPQVTDKTSGNYTCIAENKYGSATKTFEVEVISIEALNVKCNEVDGGSGSRHPLFPQSPASHNNKLIFNQNIYDLLRRSKRQLWYQWRAKTVYVPYTGSENSNYYPESSYEENRIPRNRFHHLRHPERSHNRYPESPYYPHSPHNRRYPESSYSEEEFVDTGIDVNSDMQKLVNLITERLNLADKVAVNKWDNNLPVEDLPREKIILDNMIRQAENRGLDRHWAREFFRDQIEGNKDIQYELIETWREHGRRPPGPPVDLRNEVRPQIDLINEHLIELSKRTEYERRDWNCRKVVEKNCRYAAFIFDLDHLHVRALQKATENVCVVRRPSSRSYPLFPSSDFGEGFEHDFPPV